MPGSRPGGRQPKTGAARLAVSLRRAEAIKMRLAGKTYPEIAEALGYASKANAYTDVSRALAEYVGEPAEELRTIEVTRMDLQLQRFDEMEAKVREVRDREHITVNNGRVIYVKGDDGVEKPLLDDDPVLRATQQLINIERQRADVQQRRTRLLGLDAPTKHEVHAGDDIDSAIAGLLEELGGRGQAPPGQDGDGGTSTPPG